MMFLTVTAVHWLHILAGAVWFGGTVLFEFVLWPTLLRLPAGESRSLYEALEKPAGRMFATVGQTTLVLGIVRGTWLGQIRSLDALTGTPYGHTFLTALALTIGFIASGVVTRGRLPARVWIGDEYQLGGARFIRRSSLIEVALMAAIVACMVGMHFGL